MTRLKDTVRDVDAVITTVVVVPITFVVRPALQTIVGPSLGVLATTVVNRRTFSRAL